MSLFTWFLKSGNDQTFITSSFGFQLGFHHLGSLLAITMLIYLIWFEDYSKGFCMYHSRQSFTPSIPGKTTWEVVNALARKITGKKGLQLEAHNSCDQQILSSDHLTPLPRPSETYPRHLIETIYHLLEKTMEYAGIGWNKLGSVWIGWYRLNQAVLCWYWLA